MAEVTDLLPSMDFNHFTEYYKKKRHSHVEAISSKILLLCVAL